MQKYLFLYALLTTGLLVVGSRYYRAENARLTQNQQALTATTEHYRTRLGEQVAEVQALRLRMGEFEELRAADAERIRQLGIRLRHAEATAKTITATRLTTASPLRDTILLRVRDTLIVHDTVRLFRWQDAWVRVEGEISADSVMCRVESVDTLRQVVYRVPRRFLFIRWGTKALRQQISSTNPHTTIVSTEYIQVERHRKRR